MFGMGRPQPSSQEKIAAAEQEMDLITDMFNKYVANEFICHWGKAPQSSQLVALESLQLYSILKQSTLTACSSSWRGSGAPLPQKLGMASFYLEYFHDFNPC